MTFVAGTSPPGQGRGRGHPPLFSLPSLTQLIDGIPGLLAAIVLHEWAHAAVSTALGDPVPRRQGRLSLNPLAHIDWVGMIMLWVFRFGWARPVQIDPRNYRNPRLGLVLVALAGPVMNVLIAAVCLFVRVHLYWPSAGVGGAVAQILLLAVEYNVFLAVFNILPVPPLDGSRILASVSAEGARIMAAIEPYGWIVLLILVFSGVLTGIVLLPMANAVFNFLYAVVSL